MYLNLVWNLNIEMCVNFSRIGEKSLKYKLTKKSIINSINNEKNKYERLESVKN